MLTDRFIRSAKPGTYADEGGLYLRVRATVRVFVWRRRVDGKDKWETLGAYPAMSLAEARDRLEKLKLGEDTKTVGVAFDLYYDHLAKEYAKPEQTERMFERDILPTLRHKPIDALTRADWTELIKAVTERGSPVMANRLLTQCKRFLAYCEDQGWLDENPLEKVKRRNMGGKEKPKDRNLSWEEITEFIGNLPKWGVTPGTKWALIGCLLTGLRATEVLNLTDDGKTFTKMQRWHRVPLTRHIKLWLSKRPSELPRDHRVLSHALRREAQTFTPHDLRRTLASRPADLGVLPHVVEKLLDHQMTGVMAVYNRAEYWSEREAAMRLWGRTLSRLRKKTGTEVPAKLTEEGES